jgi:hypothetical protein
MFVGKARIVALEILSTCKQLFLPACDLELTSHRSEQLASA